MTLQWQPYEASLLHWEKPSRECRLSVLDLSSCYGENWPGKISYVISGHCDITESFGS